MTIEAPRGTAADLAPYSSVTDVHGVDIYPVSVAHPTPNLQAVGKWTATLDSIAPQQPVWTTIQICASGSWDKTTNAFVIPTYQQERYMAYDAILNGAKALTFYGVQPSTASAAPDATYGLELQPGRACPRHARANSSRLRAGSRRPSSSACEDSARDDGRLGHQQRTLREGTLVDDLVARHRQPQRGWH